DDEKIIMNLPLENGITLGEMQEAKEVCITQSKEDQRTHHPRKYSRWGECLQKNLLPYLLKRYPSRAKDIEQLHIDLILELKSADRGERSFQSVATEFNDKLSAIRNYKDGCKKTFITKEGYEVCMD